jgi:hypothetical protein
MLANRCTSTTFANESRRIRGFRKIPMKNKHTFPNEKADLTELNGPYRLVRQAAHTRLQPLALQGVPVERFNSTVVDTRATICGTTGSASYVQVKREPTVLQSHFQSSHRRAKIGLSSSEEASSQVIGLHHCSIIPRALESRGRVL